MAGLNPRFLAALTALLLPLFAAAHETHVIAVASLSDPAKIATLKSERAANDRLLKILRVAARRTPGGDVAEQND